MPIFFTEDNRPNAGHVSVIVESQNLREGLISISDWDGYPEVKAIFVGMNLSAGANYQLSETFSEHSYLYVFGQKTGKLVLNGIAFSATCENDTDSHGLLDVLKFYDSHNLSVRPTPLEFTLKPDRVFTCYLESIQAQTSSPADKLLQFSMSLLVIPEE